MIEDTWNALTSASVFPVHRRVSLDHPLDLFGQLDDSGRVGLLAIADVEPDPVPVYAAVDVFVGRRSDSRWATSLSLKQPLLRPMFAAMCNEIVLQGQLCSAGSDAARFVLQHLARWTRLLSLGPDGLLSSEERLGLLGELSMLSLAIDRFGPLLPVEGWVGPDDAPQDFHLPCGFVEVKAIRSGGPEIMISSLEQLDISDGALNLAVYEFAPCSPETGGSSLAGAVNDVRMKLVVSAQATQIFERALRTAGYLDRPEYDVDQFRVAKVRWYHVANEFPRLCRSNLGRAVSAAKYKLLLAELDRFEISRVI